MSPRIIPSVTRVIELTFGQQSRADASHARKCKNTNKNSRKEENNPGSLSRQLCRVNSDGVILMRGFEPVIKIPIGCFPWIPNCEAINRSKCVVLTQCDVGKHDLRNPTCLVWVPGGWKHWHCFCLQQFWLQYSWVELNSAIRRSLAAVELNRKKPDGFPLEGTHCFTDFTVPRWHFL